MQEFRPAEVVDQDNELAQALKSGDRAALDSLVARFARAVATVTSAGGGGASDAADVFVNVWEQRHDIEPGADFATWIGGIATCSRPGEVPSDLEAVWVVAMAIDAVDLDVRSTLREHHLAGVELPDDADRHEVRLRRRLAHFGDDEAVEAALGDPAPWVDVPIDLAARIRTRLDVGSEEATAPTGDSDGTAMLGSVALADVDIVKTAGLVSRSLRPVLLGLGGAAILLLVAIVALSAASGPPDPVVFSADLRPTGVILDVEGGELTVTERSSGLQFDLDAPTLPRRGGDEFYEAVLVLRDGSMASAGTFNEGDGVTLSSGISLDRIESFYILSRQLGSDIDDVVLKLDLPLP